MTELDAVGLAARNKSNYLKAKAAFNAGDIATCMTYYALDHQIMSRQSKRGRQEIEAFLSGLRESWPGVQVIVEHAVAEGDWVMGRSRSLAVHSKPVLGAQPTGKSVDATFWDLHRFNNEGLIVETWNLMDNLAIMQQLGLMNLPGGAR